MEAAEIYLIITLASVGVYLFIQCLELKAATKELKQERSRLAEQLAAKEAALYGALLREQQRGPIDRSYEEFQEMADNVRDLAEAMIEEHIGDRCADGFEESCVVCKRWKALDDLIENPYKNPFFSPLGKVMIGIELRWAECVDRSYPWVFQLQQRLRDERGQWGDWHPVPCVQISAPQVLSGEDAGGYYFCTNQISLSKPIVVQP